MCAPVHTLHCQVASRLVLHCHLVDTAHTPAQTHCCIRAGSVHTSCGVRGSSSTPAGVAVPDLAHEARLWGVARHPACQPCCCCLLGELMRQAAYTLSQLVHARAQLVHARAQPHIWPKHVCCCCSGCVFAGTGAIQFPEDVLVRMLIDDEGIKAGQHLYGKNCPLGEAIYYGA